MHAGSCAGFKANEPDGHCLQNRSPADATVLEIGSRFFDAIEAIGEEASTAFCCW